MAARSGRWCAANQEAGAYVLATRWMTAFCASERALSAIKRWEERKRKGRGKEEEGERGMRTRMVKERKENRERKTGRGEAVSASMERF
eukprot:774491-Rhodomonas_salina.3